MRRYGQSQTDTPLRDGPKSVGTVSEHTGDPFPPSPSLSSILRSGVRDGTVWPSPNNHHLPPSVLGGSRDSTGTPCFTLTVSYLYTDSSPSLLGRLVRGAGRTGRHYRPRSISRHHRVLQHCLRLEHSAPPSPYIPYQGERGVPPAPYLTYRGAHGDLHSSSITSRWQQDAPPSPSIACRCVHGEPSSQYLPYRYRLAWWTLPGFYGNFSTLGTG